MHSDMLIHLVTDLPDPLWVNSVDATASPSR